LAGHVCQYDVCSGLARMGYEVQQHGVSAVIEAKAHKRGCALDRVAAHSGGLNGGGHLSRHVDEVIRRLPQEVQVPSGAVSADGRQDGGTAKKHRRRLQLLEQADQTQLQRA
jgi:hypothetical protein